MSTLAFSISGEFITEHVRERVLSGDWRGALTVLVDGIHGITYDQSIQILKGEKALVDVEGGLDITDQDQTDEELQSYLKTLKRQNVGLLKINGKVYVPYARVTSFGREDLLDEDTDKKYDIDPRARHYCDNPEEDIITVPEGKFEYPVLWKQVDPPCWLETTHSHHQALTSYISLRALPERGWDQSYGDYSYSSKENENTGWKEDLTNLREQIIKQVEERGNRWYELKDITGMRTVATVPEIPLMRWALRYHRHLCPEWENVCPGNFKMTMDNRDHSDWMVGAGIDPTEQYDIGDSIQRAAYRYAFDVALDMLNSDIVVLAKGLKEEYTGVIAHVQPDTDIDALDNPNSWPRWFEDADIIIVLPDGSPKWHTVFMHPKVIGAICEIGGPLSHIATISREMEKFVIMEPGAMSRYQHGRTTVTIDVVDNRSKIKAEL